MKRFTAEAGIQAQRSLSEYQQKLGSFVVDIEGLRKRALENEEVFKRSEAKKRVEMAEDRAHQAERSACAIFDEAKVAAMTAMAPRLRYSG